MRIAIVGASGAVGLEIIKILEERKFKLSSIDLFGSKRSAGKSILYKSKSIKIRQLKKSSLKNFDIVFFSAGSDISKKYAPIATSNGCYVIDNSSAFRMDKNTALVVPEINKEDLSKYKSKIIANPNCTTIISLMAIKPLYDLASINRIVATSFQSVSGAGNMGMSELISDSKSFLSGSRRPKGTVFERNIAFNAIPKIGDITNNLYSQEEMKLHNESRKILSNNKIFITATTVRVPILRSHSISLNIEFNKNVTLSSAKKALSNFPGLKNINITDSMEYPTPLDSSNKDHCLIGRLRKDYSVKFGLSLWVVGDQIRKGAALNAVQIAECLQKN